MGNLRYKVNWVKLMVGTQIKKYIFRNVFALFCLYLRDISNYKVSVTYIRSGDLTEGFCTTSWGGEGAYFRNFTIVKLRPDRDKENEMVESCPCVTEIDRI